MALDGEIGQRSLVGKRVLIIGGVGEGIGRAITRSVARAGASGIVVVGRNAARAAEAAAEVDGPACKAVGFAADVCDSAQVGGVTEFAARELGGLEALITVVGGLGSYVPWEPLETTSEDHWKLIFDVNLNYVFWLLKDIIKLFLSQGTGGAIVCVGSNAGVLAMPRGAAYGAAKAGLISLARSVAAEYGRRGIRMNVVNSGVVLTQTIRNQLGSHANFEPVPMGRPGEPEEIADMVTFMASPLASYITGQAINVDGGITSRGPMPMPTTDSSMACHCGSPAAAKTPA